MRSHSQASQKGGTLEGAEEKTGSGGACGLWLGVRI